jgi:glutamyl-tRNA synthetase
MPIPKFAHVGLIHHQKKKLSKRDDAASMLYYRDQGYDPDAILNFILRLGWGPKNENKSHKLIDRSRAIDLFLKDGNMRSAPSNMDLNQLESYDRKYKAQKNIWRNKDRLVTENEV